MQRSRAALCVEVFESFDAVPAAMVATFDGVNANGFFASWFWYRNLYEKALAVGDQLRLYVVRTADATATTLLVMPMVHARVTPRFGLRTLRSCTNFYSPLFVPLIQCDSNKLERCIEVWMSSVSAERPRWDALSLAPLDCAQPYFAQLNVGMRAVGFTPHDYFCFGNWHHRLASSDYAAYVKKLAGPTRNMITRKCRALKRMAQFHIVVCRNADQVGEAQLAYQKVFAASWKRPEPYSDFIPALIAGAAQRGVLRLGIAYVGEQAVACQLWLVEDGVASIFKLAYVEAFAEWSVGTVLMAAMMQQVIEVDRVNEVDFLSGDDAFKKDWMSARRERRGYIAFNQHSVPGRAAGLLEFLKGQWRQRAARQPVVKV